MSTRLPTIRLTRFDRLVIATVAVLLAALAITIVLGDHVGVTLVRFGPQDNARTTQWITLQFSETMDRASVTDRLTVAPALATEASWSSNTLILRPLEVMPPGATYTVTLAAGAQSTGGRAVLAEHVFSFTVQLPDVVYLAPANGTPQNLWLASGANPDAARQITFSEAGIFNYDVSPDGSRIAFAEHNRATNSIDLKLLDLASGEITPLLACPEADCTTPVWSPDGRTIAYERMDFNRDVNTGASPTRVWLLDMSATPATTRPLFNDSQVLGSQPVWSPDGRYLASFDASGPGIIVYDWESGESALIPSNHGVVGTFSPDGTRLLYPNAVFTETGSRTNMQIADLTTRQITPLTEAGEPLDDERAAWNPDGSFIAVSRRYLDDRYTAGRQLYRLDPETGEASPLLVDEGYYHGYFEWDPTGQQLLVQRFPQPGDTLGVSDDVTPEIWALDVAHET
ncbi:MAG: PD40 domain-containing protein, partial [Anaerolineae bacterium]|nr:PD40 domain-containing protein [Anaerolineae bacterium]